MSTAATAYSTEQLEYLAAILERTTPGVVVGRDDLGQRLLDLLGAVGRADDGSEYEAAFRARAESTATHADLATRFRAIAEAEDPLDPALYTGTAAAELNAAARARWSSRKRRRLNRPHPLRGMSAEFLTPEELADVRAMALHLAAFHQSFVQRKAPTKSDQDTLLEGLADIYLEFARLDGDRYDLPHSQSSRFVQFVHGALRPFFGPTEASSKAIAHRWLRLKNAAKAEP